MTLPSTIDVKLLTEADFQKWYPLWQGYLTFYKSELSDEMTKLTWARFHDGSEPIHAVGAFDQDRLVGFAHFIFHRSTWSANRYCYMEDLFVDPEIRGMGAGAELIKSVEVIAKKADCDRLYWVTQNNNETAKKLYDKVSQNSGFIQYRTSLK